MVRLGALSAAFLLAGALTGVALAFVPHVEAALSRRGAILVDDQLLPRDVPLRPFVERMAARVAAREAYLRLPEGLEPTMFSEIGIEVDVDATLAEVARALPVRSGS